MIREAMEEMEGISFGGFNITDLRYADDAMLVSDKKKKLQKMIDKLNDTCKEYAMDINVRKTKVIVVGGDGAVNGSKACFIVADVPFTLVIVMPGYSSNYHDTMCATEPACGR